MSVGYLVEQAHRRHRNRTAIVCEARSLSFADVAARARRLANALHGLGCEPGSRVAVLIANCLQSMEIEFGCAAAGVTRVSLNHRSSRAGLEAALEKMDVSGLIFDAEHAEFAAAIAESDPSVALIQLGGDTRAHMAVRGYEDALAAASDRWPASGATWDSLYCLFSTSGTTGVPKGVIHTHRSQLAVATGLLLEFAPVRPGGKILLPQPLSHGGGFFMLPYALSGGTCVVMQRFDPEAAMALAREHQIETLKVVPTMLIQMLQHGARATDTYAPERIIYGAAPMARDWLLQALESFGPVLAQLYGQAEAPMCITVLDERDHEDESLLASAGRPWRNVEVRVVDESGARAEPGEMGEVTVRGDHVMAGYWRDEEATREVLRDGCVFTRDLATVDDRGYVYLQGRKDEMINSGGFNIAPRSVEQALVDHPDVIDAAVLGEPDPEWGQIIKAYVVTHDSAASAEDLIEFCRARLASFERPRKIELVAELPRNAYGKVDRQALVGAKPDPEPRD